MLDGIYNASTVALLGRGSVVGGEEEQGRLGYAITSRRGYDGGVADEVLFGAPFVTSVWSKGGTNPMDEVPAGGANSGRAFVVLASNLTTGAII